MMRKSGALIIMSPFEEEGSYCFAYVGRSVRPSVRPSSVDQMASDHYLKNYLLQSFYILRANWPW